MRGEGDLSFFIVIIIIIAIILILTNSNHLSVFCSIIFRLWNMGMLV